ncbi:MAG: hypothetical protein JSS55_05535 [Proteobacteria bacterium]|nr:hypothetical protein [Pseudomonadota bacterium]
MLRTFLLVSSLIAVAPVSAKWIAVPAANRAPVAGGALTVKPEAGWNRWSKKPTKQSELWSFDGPLLNQIQFFGGVGSGQPLARERNKKREPLPKFKVDMKATEVAEAFEQTIRVTQGASDFAIDQIEPAAFGATQGFRFAYHYTAGELVRKGEVRGAIVKNKLYMIAYSAPALHYYDAHLAGAQAVMDSAQIN